VLRIDLFVKIAGVEKHVNRELINMGYADSAEESYLSHVSSAEICLPSVHCVGSRAVALAHLVPNFTRGYYSG